MDRPASSPFMGRFCANQIFCRLGEEACCVHCHSFRDFSIRLRLSSSRLRDSARRSVRAALQSSARCAGGGRSFPLLPVFFQQWRRRVSTRTLYGLSTFCGFAALFCLACVRSGTRRGIFLSRSGSIAAGSRVQIGDKRDRYHVAGFWFSARSRLHFSPGGRTGRTRVTSEHARCDCLLDRCPGSKWNHFWRHLGAHEKSLRAHAHSRCRATCYRISRDSSGHGFDAEWCLPLGGVNVSIPIARRSDAIAGEQRGIFGDERRQLRMRGFEFFNGLF